MGREAIAMLRITLSFYWRIMGILFFNHRKTGSLTIEKQLNKAKFKLVQTAKKLKKIVMKGTSLEQRSFKMELW
jgi:hypothetical protein